ncbi:LOG family protein [Litorivivens sp.]|uniref:LOG family protein n=1 Tax=Litorivivens sp. TaxID=2020868 RepID=UPI003564F314
MSKKKGPRSFGNVAFPSAAEDATYAKEIEETPQTKASAYRLAFADDEFLLRNELRPVRLQLELLKPEMTMQEWEIDATIVMFGSARIPDPATAELQVNEAQAALKADPDNASKQKLLVVAENRQALSGYYDEARRLAAIIGEQYSGTPGMPKVHVMTGGGPGIMEAANRGADDVGAESIGLNIVLPHEQRPNAWITPELSFRFHYFALRKMHFLMRAKALVVFPGGFGTLDEFFETLTLLQTQKVKSLPILVFGREFWEKVLNFEVLVEHGMISEEDLELFTYVESADQAWAVIRQQCES